MTGVGIRRAELVTGTHVRGATDGRPISQTAGSQRTGGHRPDSTPPSRISQLASQGNTVYVTAQTETLMAPISQYSTTVYSSSGTAVAGQATVAEVNASGQVELGLGLESTPALAVGTYTVAFALTDSGGLTTSYGGPGQNPVPGGPLTFTVTAG
jgi:hypothetical protein